MTPLSEGEPSNDGGPSPSGLSQYYWALSPSYSLVVIEALRNGPRLSLLGVVEAVVVLT